MRRMSSPSAVLPSVTFILCLLIALAAAWDRGPRGAEPDETVGTRLLRYPALSKESIAFVYGGDIWTVPRSGGTARQITSDPGLEILPRFSPDGRWIAFTGQY